MAVNAGRSAIQPSSVDRTLDIFGVRGAFVIMREALFGVRRFDDFQRNLAMSRSALSKRLRRLVDEGILERRLYQHRPDRYEYRLTERGRDMYPIFISLMRWGDRWLSAEEGPPVLLYHEPCGNQTMPVMVCEHCGEEIRARDVHYEPGPGAWSEKRKAAEVDPG
jgi:DNA-binding HxlR family transcriptional regulator